MPPILAGALARGDLGLDFDGTGYAFLESPTFLVAVLTIAVLSYALERSRRASSKPRGAASARDPVALAFAAVAVALGALLFAGSLAEGGEEAWPGLVAGAACALLGWVAVTGLLARARRRLDAGAAALLPVWADAGALALAVVAVAFPPAALLGVAALVYLVVAGRQAGARKYQGLRVLR